MERYLLTRGDDLGSFSEANAAIADCHRHGILRNASIMVPAAAYAEAADIARSLPELCLGLHLTLTSEWDQVRWGPLLDASEVPSLVDADGHFLSDPLAIHARGVVLEEAMRELRAQLARARADGLDIRYVDEHMGVAWIHPPGRQPRLQQAIRAWAREEGLIYHEDVIRTEVPDLLKGLTRPISPDLVAELIAALEPGISFLVTHPAYERGWLPRLGLRCGEQREPGSQAAERAEDAAILLDRGVRAACTRNVVRPVTYTEASAQLARLGLDAIGAT